jgi:hypothetical protein
MGDGGQLIVPGSVLPAQQSRQIRLAARRVSGTYHLNEDKT